MKTFIARSAYWRREVEYPGILGSILPVTDDLPRESSSASTGATGVGMHVEYKRRAGEERRAFTLYYRYGNERRNNTGNRRQDTVKVLRPYLARGTAQGDAGSPDQDGEIIKEIADAFGVQPDTLELVDHDDLVDTVEICQSCADCARRIEKLEGELAESRIDSERYRNQVKELLQSSNSRS